MAHLIVTGIVTRYVNYRESDRILTLFTVEQGRMDARARGCRRPKSQLLACAQPFIYGEFQLFENKSKFSIDQCDIRETFYPLREDIEKLNAAFAMLSLAQNVIQEGEANEPLFMLLYHGLSYLSYGEAHPVDLLLAYVARYLQVIGICPTVTDCAICRKDLRKDGELRFSQSAGGAICMACARSGHSAAAVSALSLEAMRRMLLMGDRDMDKVKLPPPVRRELFSILEQYCSYYLDRENKPLQTLKPFLQ